MWYVQHLPFMIEIWHFTLFINIMNIEKSVHSFKYKCFQKYWRLNKILVVTWIGTKSNPIQPNHKMNGVYLALIAYHKLKSEAICFPNWNSWKFHCTILIGKCEKMPKGSSKLFQSKFYWNVMASEFINDFTGILVG